MKFLEKVALVLFSIVISIMAIALILLMLDVIQMSVIARAVTFLLNDDFAFKITLAVTIVMLLLALKCIFFGAKKDDDGRNGVTLENASGKLVISRESLENLIANVVKDVQGIEAISSRTFLDRNNNLVVYVTTLVSKDMMIKDVSTQIQEKIKEALSKTADLEVKQVNIKVKNITNKKIKGLPEAKFENNEESDDTKDTREEENIENEARKESEENG